MPLEPSGRPAWGGPFAFFITGDSVMNTYTVHFCTDAHQAARVIDAETPQQALDQARLCSQKHQSELWFEPFDEMPINEIGVYDADGKEVAIWQDQDLLLRLAAPNLLQAAEKVIARWEQGNLAEAVRELEAAITEAKGGESVSGCAIPSGQK
jgi:hypothetical protein